MAELYLSRETLQPPPKVVVLRIAGELDESNGRKVETYFDETVAAERPRDVTSAQSEVCDLRNAQARFRRAWAEPQRGIAAYR